MREESLIDRETRRYGAVAVLILASLPVFAAVPDRVEIFARLDGQRVSGGEACFFRAGDGPGPLASFLKSREIRCLPADRALELPAGRWWYYVRNMDRNLIGAVPSAITILDLGAPMDRFQRIDVALRPAAALDLTRIKASLGSDDRLAVYISNERTDSQSMLLPIARDDTTVLVPSGMAVVLLLLRNNLVVNMSDPILLEKGERRLAPAFQTLAADKSNIIAWVELPEDARQTGDYWRILPAPKVTLEGGGKAFTPMIAPRPGFGIDGALLIFRNLPFADYSLRIGGPLWTAGDLPVQARNAGIIVPDQGLVTRPAASLAVEWSVNGPPPDTPHGDCAPPPETTAAATPATATAKLLTCDGLQPTMTPRFIQPERCKPFADAVTIDGRTRRAAFHGVKAGTYLLSVHEPGYPLGYAVATLTTAQEGHSAIAFDAFHVLGRVTLDDNPVKARLEYRSGMAFSDDDGRFYGALPLPPKNFTISVIRCSDGELLGIHKPLHPLETNVPHDIRIETNEVQVAIVDAETHRGVPKASFTGYSVAEDDEWDFLSETTVPTDADGKGTYHNAPADQKVAICASAPHYKHTCTEPFKFSGTREHSVQIELPPTHHTGRIVTNHEFLWGFVCFVGPDRAVREGIYINPDGTFEYRLEHTSPEYVVVASDLPLFAQALPDAIPGELTIPVPDLPIRSFDVSLSPATGKKDARIGLFIAGRYIPSDALSKHETFRGLQGMILGGGPYRIPDVFAAGPIQVGLGASPEEPDFVEESRFLLPKPASLNLIIKEVDATNHVVF